MNKKIIRAIIWVILIFGGMLMLSSCETKPEIFTLKFISTPFYEKDDTSQIPYSITWDENTFNTPPEKFSKTLAKTALVLSSSAYSYENAMDNLETLGFEHKAKFNFSDSYDKDAVGLIIAERKIEDTSVIFMLLRGTYLKEWYSNFEIGKDTAHTNVHEGFNKASEFVLEKLNMYMVNYGVDRDNCKFLVTGHSRGAAVANLAAKALIDTYDKENVYAYTFATPNTTLSDDAKSKKYDSIFNFVNPEDFIAYIPLEKWGFKKYGTTIAFPTRDTDENYDAKIKKVSEYYEKYKGRAFRSFDGTESKEEFIKSAFELAPTIKDYYDTKYEIAALELSLYEYMNIFADLLNEENLISNGLILLSSDNTKFEPIKNYISSGMETSDDLFSLDYDNSLISYSHPAETYLAWLEVYAGDL